MSDWDILPGETPLDRSGLKRPEIRSRADLNRAEAENIRKVVVRYLAAKPSKRMSPFTLTWTARLHRQMFGEVWSWAGVFRKENLNLGCDWYQVPIQVQLLLDDLAYWEQAAVPIATQAARLHHRAVLIHPFVNGNGRWGRMLANIQLKRRGRPIVVWPEEVIGSKSLIRDEYLTAIRAADKGDEDPLIELHRRYSGG